MQAVFGVSAPWRHTEAPGSTSQGYNGPEESYAANVESWKYESQKEMC